jgi:para-nitrobenzyl esterase
VIVFIHGGAYMTGSGEDARYDSHRLAADGDVVTVNVSYRLGALGYLHLPDRGAVNLGLQDQLAALEWVHANIAAFGGDPANVTLLGQSAGAHAIATMLATLDRPPCRRAILHSPPLAATLTVAEAEKTTSLFLEALGEDPLSASLEALLRAQAAANEREGRAMLFSPVAGSFDPPKSMTAPELDLLITWTCDDSAPFVALRNRGTLEAYGSPQDLTATSLATEALFGRPARDFARSWTAAGAAVSLHRFDWRPDGVSIGAGHCLDLALLLGSEADWSGAFMLGRATDQEVSRMGREMRRAWGAFAADGTPPQGLPWLPRIPLAGSTSA